MLLVLAQLIRNNKAAIMIANADFTAASMRLFTASRRALAMGVRFQEISFFGRVRRNLTALKT